MSCTESDSEASEEETQINNNEVPLMQTEKQPDPVEKKRSVNFYYYEGVNEEESAAIQARRRLRRR